MNKSRKLSLINMFMNLALIGLEIAGVCFFAMTNPHGFSVTDLRYYTVLTVFVTMLGAALMVWANIISFIKKRDCTPRLFYSIRYLSAVMSLITIIVVAAFIAPKQGIKTIFSLHEGFVFMHFVCPIISVLQFICLEIEPKGKFKKTFEPFIATIVYAIGIIVTLFVVKANEGAVAASAYAPYFFFGITPELAQDGGNYLYNIGIAAAVLVIAYAASVLLWLLNRMSHAIFIGEVYEIEVPNQPKGGELTLLGEETSFTNYMKKKVAFGDNKPAATGGQTYHISYHDRKLKTWKVKTENAGRALKVFPTQKEAIEFAKACVKKSGGSIRIHSMVGRIRKDW